MAGCLGLVGYVTSGLGCSAALLLGSLGLKSGSQALAGVGEKFSGGMAGVMAWVLCSSLDFPFFSKIERKCHKNVLNFTPS